uniref:Uncharacterized protein n=1 Tax=Ananas comosus var. bracteatus TaxID=296719 RepID=A0A6V7PVR5_ANACO|nr:unnamed protein product [Ananas comosus var. bracteatus]
MWISRFPRSEIVVQTVRCSSSQFPTSAGASRMLQRLALRRIRDECDLKLKDINYDDSLFYKNLYDHQTTNYAILSAQYGNLSWEYNLLKDEYVDDRIKLRNAIVECVNRLPAEQPAPAADPSDAMSNQLA